MAKEPKVQGMRYLEDFADNSMGKNFMLEDFYIKRAHYAHDTLESMSPYLNLPSGQETRNRQVEEADRQRGPQFIHSVCFYNLLVGVTATMMSMARGIEPMIPKKLEISTRILGGKLKLKMIPLLDCILMGIDLR